MAVHGKSPIARAREGELDRRLQTIPPAPNCKLPEFRQSGRVEPSAITHLLGFNPPPRLSKGRIRRTRASLISSFPKWTRRLHALRQTKVNRASSHKKRQQRVARNPSPPPTLIQPSPPRPAHSSAAPTTAPLHTLKSVQGLLDELPLDPLYLVRHRSPILTALISCERPRRSRRSRKGTLFNGLEKSANSLRIYGFFK